MSAEAFGQPDGADTLMVIAELWYQRGLVPDALRIFLSGFPREQRLAFLQEARIQAEAYPE